MLDFIGFMFFSTIEGLGILAIMLKIFSYKFIRFLAPALFLITIMNLQSYFLREELSLENVVPLINIFLFIAFLSIVMKIPFFASIIITGAGFFVFAIIQASIIELTPNGYFSIDEVQTNHIKGYLVQLITASINFSLAWLLNIKRIGFIENLIEKLRMKHEQKIVLSIVGIILVLFTSILYLQNVVIHIAMYIIASLFFIYYAYRKEIS
ncbi:MAG: hypothetical protein ACQEXQ_16215 [Bacillota bacterium]